MIRLLNGLSVGRRRKLETKNTLSFRSRFALVETSLRVSLSREKTRAATRRDISTEAAAVFLKLIPLPETSIEYHQPNGRVSESLHLYIVDQFVFFTADVATAYTLRSPPPRWTVPSNSPFIRQCPLNSRITEAKTCIIWKSDVTRSPRHLAAKLGCTALASKPLIRRDVRDGGRWLLDKQALIPVRVRSLNVSTLEQLQMKMKKTRIDRMVQISKHPTLSNDLLASTWTTAFNEVNQSL